MMNGPTIIRRNDWNSISAWVFIKSVTGRLKTSKVKMILSKLFGVTKTSQ